MFAAEQVEDSAAEAVQEAEEPVEMLRSYSFNPDES
jgi:hypothetical protein